MTTFKTGFTVMRLQPLHNGHLNIIKTMASECEKSLVLVGSAESLRTPRNPFILSERVNMLQLNISEKNVFIGWISDINNRPLWAGHTLEVASRFFNQSPDAYYCGEFQDADLFRGKVNIREFPRRDPKELSGTDIRELVRMADPSWKLHVPENIHSVVEEVYNKYGVVFYDN